MRMDKIIPFGTIQMLKGLNEITIKNSIVRKYFIMLPVLIMVSSLYRQLSFADRYDDSNKYYLDAYNLYRLGKVDESLELLKKVIEIDPDHAEAYFGMGSIYFRQSRFADAVREFTNVIRLKPEYAQAYERLWLAYKRLGMNDGAEEAFRSYRKVIAERTRIMNEEPPQVVKSADLPSNQSSEAVGAQSPRVKGETPQATGIKSSAERDQKINVTESKPVRSETEVKKSSTIEIPKSSSKETKVARAKPKESLKQPPEVTSVINSNPEYRSPVAKAEGSKPKYRLLFKPFKSFFSKSSEVLKKSFVSRFLKGFIYYIIVVQVWLCIVAVLFIYWRKGFILKREEE
ncbi:MAG: tetratricopeptide repeat protein [wastewater metagenome]|nr:tetratricopeptide repeat protein [Candidatus Loosdrechtia aerotolerans]